MRAPAAAALAVLAAAGLGLGGALTLGRDAAGQPARAAEAGPGGADSRSEAARRPASLAQRAAAGHLGAALDGRTPAWTQAHGGRRLPALGRRTEFGTRQVVAVAAVSGDRLGVRTPTLPNDRLAWVRRADVRLVARATVVEVDRSARVLEVRRAGRTVLRARVGVGGPASMTPLGSFGVTDRLRPRSGPLTAYGCCVLALTGHQTAELPGWTGGDRLAVHTTAVRDDLGRGVSHGCVRATPGVLRRILALVPEGSTVRVRA